jgi:hypothetical protein
VNEQEWLDSVDSKPMLKWLKGKASIRQLRLFIVAVLRTGYANRKTLPNYVRESVDWAELMADGKWQRKPGDQKLLHLSDNAHYAAVCVAKWQDEGRGKSRVTRQMQAAMLREVFGNPFRPTFFEPRLREWRDGTIPKLAQRIYDEKTFQHLPILADALEEAGCDSMEILNHCRQPGAHVRGCWVLDLVLGKESNCFRAVTQIEEASPRKAVPTVKKRQVKRKQMQMGDATFGRIVNRLRRCEMRGLTDKGFLRTSVTHESCMTARYRKATDEDKARWSEQIRAAYEAVLGEDGVTKIVVRHTLKNYLAFDVITVRKWR